MTRLPRRYEQSFRASSRAYDATRQYRRRYKTRDRSQEYRHNCESAPPQNANLARASDKPKRGHNDCRYCLPYREIRRSTAFAQVRHFLQLQLDGRHKSHKQYRFHLTSLFRPRGDKSGFWAQKTWAGYFASVDWSAKMAV